MIDVEAAVDRVVAVLQARLPHTVGVVNLAGGEPLRLPASMEVWNPEEQQGELGDVYVGGAPDRPHRWPAIEVSVDRATLERFDLAHRAADDSTPIVVVVWDADGNHPRLVRRCWRWSRALYGALLPDPELLFGRGVITRAVADFGAATLDPTARTTREPYVGWSILTLEVEGYSTTS